MTRRRKLLFVTLLACAMGTGLLALGEIWFHGLALYERPWRIAWFQRRPTTMPYTDPARSFQPGLGWVRTRESPYAKAGRMNSWGYPDGEFGPKNGRFRIALVGDSVTFGSGVKDLHAIFGSLVEDMLNAAAREPGSFEVVNLGTEGYSMVQIYATLEHIVFRWLDPDLVLYEFSPNDFVDLGIEAYETGQRYPSQCFDEERFDFRAPRTYFVRERIHFWLESHSSLYEELRYRMALFRYQVVLPLVAELNAPSAPQWAKDAGDRLRERFPSLRPFTRACSDDNQGYVTFDNLVALCRDAGRPLVVLSTPTFEFLDDPDPTYQMFFDWYFEKHPQVPLWNPVDDMRAGLHDRGLTGHAICVSDRDCHPNELGHRLIAESLFRFLAQQPGVRERLRDPLVDPRSLLPPPAQGDAPPSNR